MATLVSKNRGRKLAEQRRRLTLAQGAQSAFDISGLRILTGDLFGTALQPRLEPTQAVASDVARVMRTFGRSCQVGRAALAAGRDIDDLRPGSTTPDDGFQEAVDTWELGTPVSPNSD